MIVVEAPPRPTNRCLIITPCSSSVYILLTVSTFLPFCRGSVGRIDALLPYLLIFSVNKNIGKSTFLLFFGFSRPLLLFSPLQRMDFFFSCLCICMGRNCRSHGRKNCANLQMSPAGDRPSNASFLAKRSRRIIQVFLFFSACFGF